MAGRGPRPGPERSAVLRAGTPQRPDQPRETTAVSEPMGEADGAAEPPATWAGADALGEGRGARAAAGVEGASGGLVGLDPAEEGL